MKKIVFILITLTTFFGYAQKKDKALIVSNDYVYEANELVSEDFVSAEMEYRKAISEKPTNVVGAYNLGNAYYKNQKFGEALLRHQDVIKKAITKEEKHKTYHNIGNALMQGKQCKEAVEAFKSALRNNPNDDETRYNLGLAKKCAEEQGGGGGEDENKDENQDQKKDQENEDNKDKKDGGDEDQENKDEGEDEEDKKDGEDKEDEEGKPKDEKKDEGKGDDQKKEQPKPQQGQLSPQQIKNLLEAMNDQEQKVQEKINAQQAKGVKVQSDKDW